MGKAIFITGTDTEVGKTVVTGLLGRYLLDQGVKTITQKWVQTGCVGFSEDIAIHMALMGKTEEDIEEYFMEVAPYILDFPSSPHLAAKLEDTVIDSSRIEKCFYKLREEFEVVLVEGAGGPMVPIDESKMMIDIVEDDGMPVLMVAENKLGAINQTLLTVEALRGRDIQVIGIVFNQRSPKENEIILQDNPRIVEKVTGVEVLGELPYSNDIEQLYSAFKPIGEKCEKKLSERT